MRKSILLLCILPAVVVLDRTAESKSSGLFPGELVNSTNVGTLTRVSGASCGGPGAGSCQRATPFLTTVGVTVGQRVLGRNQSTSITVSGTSTVTGNRGGFAADVTLGTLVAGTNSRVNAAADAITHQNSFATGRTWTFGFQAGTTTGLAELFTVVNCVDGDGRESGSDWWALHGQPFASQTTPVRLYVNADGVKSTGDGCSDGFGNVPILGAPLSPTVGNQGFRLEGHSLPPSAFLLVMMSVGANAPVFDLKPLGAEGCKLRTAQQLEFAGATTAGNAERAEGKVVIPAPIPNDSTLKGVVLSIQLGAVDKNTKRAFGGIVSNGIEMTVL